MYWISAPPPPPPPARLPFSDVMKFSSFILIGNDTAEFLSIFLTYCSFFYPQLTHPQPPPHLLLSLLLPVSWLGNHTFFYSFSGWQKFYKHIELRNWSASIFLPFSQTTQGPWNFYLNQISTVQIYVISILFCLLFYFVIYLLKKSSNLDSPVKIFLLDYIYMA